jgi:hypothetical protein
MKKGMALFLLTVVFSSALWAQVYEGTAEYDKKKYTAFLAEYDYQAPAVENALLKRFSKLGYRPREEKGLLNRDKGFKVFAGSIMNDITEGQADYLVKVEKRSRKEREISLLTIIILQKGEALGRSVSEERANKVKSYLKSIIPDVAAESLELDIKAQEDAILKAEKKLEGLKKEQGELERKLENNGKAQQDTENEIKAKQEGLQILKSKRVTPALQGSGSGQKTNP